MSDSSISLITKRNIRSSPGRVRRGQATFEYLVILGVVLALLLPAIYLFYTRSQSNTQQISIQHLDQMGGDIVNDVAYVYPYGAGSKTTLDFTMPVGVTNITVHGDPASGTGNEFVINLDVNGVNQSLVYFSKYPIFIGNCTKSIAFSSAFLSNPGKKTMQIISCGSNVSVYEKQ